MKRGFAAFARGDARAALEEYERAEALVPEANLPYRYAAEALAQLGRTADAIASLEHYLSLKPDVSDAAAARARIEVLRAQLPSTLVLSCSEPEVSVSIDERASVDSRCPVELALAPGSHTLTIRASHHRIARLTVVSTAGAAATLPLAFEYAPAHAMSPAVSTAPKPEAAPGERGPSPLRPTAAYVAFGGAAALLAGALVVDLALLGPAMEDYDAANRTSDPRAASRRDHVRALQTVGLVGYAGAAALTVTGGVLWLVSKRASVRASSAADGAEVRATLSF